MSPQEVKVKNSMSLNNKASTPTNKDEQHNQEIENNIIEPENVPQSVRTFRGSLQNIGEEEEEKRDEQLGLPLSSNVDRTNQQESDNHPLPSEIILIGGVSTNNFEDENEEFMEINKASTGLPSKLINKEIDSDPLIDNIEEIASIGEQNKESNKEVNLPSPQGEDKNMEK